MEMIFANKTLYDPLDKASEISGWIRWIKGSSLPY
jgi:hypothetical protein